MPTGAALSNIRPTALTSFHSSSFIKILLLSLALLASITLLLCCSVDTATAVNNQPAGITTSEQFQTQPPLIQNPDWRSVAKRRTIFQFAIFALQQVVWFGTLTWIFFGGYGARWRRQLAAWLRTLRLLRMLRAFLWLRARSVEARRMNRHRRRWRNNLMMLFQRERLIYLVCVGVGLCSFALFQLFLAWSNYALNRIYGVTTQPFLSWTGEYLIGLTVMVAGGGVLILVIRHFVKISPGRWWLWCLACVIAIEMGLFQNNIKPWVIGHFINDVSLIRDQTVEPELRELARRCLSDGEVAGKIRFREVNYSRKTQTINVYTQQNLDVTAIGFSDTMLRLPRKQVLFSAAHEFGHVAHPEWASLLIHLIFIAGGFFSVYIFGIWLIRRYQAQIGVRDFTDPAALPLAVLILSLFMLSHTLTANYLSRQREGRADLFAAACTVPEVVARQDARDVIENTGASELLDAEPHPLIKIFLYDHPPTDERLRAITAFEEHGTAHVHEP